MGTVLRRVGALTAVLSVVAASSAGAAPMTFTVNTTADTNGTCSTFCTLRQAINSANVNSGPDTINIQSNVLPTSALPLITGQTDVEGVNSPTIDGKNISTTADGLSFSSGSAHSVVQGVAIDRFKGSGIVVTGSDSTTINDCILGADANSTTGLGNGQAGVGIGSSTGVQVSNSSIVGNQGDGIRVLASAEATIVGNAIGMGISTGEPNPNVGNGVRISGGSSTVGGTAADDQNTIVANGNDGILLDGSASARENNILGNLIGIDSSDELFGNGSEGIEVSGSGENTIGGSAAGAGNVISGNRTEGIFLFNTFKNQIKGNRIGTSVDGNHPRANQSSGMFLGDTNDNIIGGPGSAGNLISGNFDEGIRLGDGTAGNVIENNRVGTNAAGDVALPNGEGITSRGSNQIGSSNAAGGNLVSGNLGEGILVNSTGHERIEGNIIGANHGGTNPVPNGGPGIILDQNGATVGGTGGAVNTIAFNNGPGIQIGSQPGNVNSVPLENSTFNNVGLGIDVGPAGVTPNDAGDADAIQNFPTLSAAISNGSTTLVHGSIATAPNRQVRLRFFASPTCDPSGFGEGKTPLGVVTLTANGAGIAAYETSLPARTSPGQQITATAASSVGSSEFSGCRTITVPPQLAFTKRQTSAREGTTAKLTVLRSGNLGVTSTVTFSTRQGSAKAGRDFLPTKGKLTFAPGQSRKTITVKILKDKVRERTEAFHVKLRAPTNASLGRPGQVKVGIPGNRRAS